jgi:8-oxo-dGTP pyrophosphatase MutT (NUDIX family)
LQGLVQKYGAPREVTLTLPSIEFPPVSERRHGEVCMAILRRNRRFLLQTKRSYPGAVMRLPSGGIKAGEDIEHALLREIWEETNLEVNVDRYVAQLSYEDRSGLKSRFRTHLFLVHELDGELQCNDPHESISDWCEVSPDDLLDYSAKLATIQPDWGNWGLFRAGALDVLAHYCAEAELHST